MASPTLLATSSSPPAALPAAVSAAALPKWVVFGTSGLGGVMGWCVVHPFNTLAVRMSLAAAAGKTFRIGDTSLGSLYDGLSAGMLRQVFYATSRFGLFETARDAYAEHYGGVDFGARVVIGAVTGGMAAYISCPMEVAVVRMSNDKTLPLDERRNYKNVFDTASRVIKEEGVSAFWRGSNPFVSRAMMVGIFQVATLDQFKDYYAARFDQVKNSVSNVFCAAMTSGLIYSIATMPLEATKNRMASQKRMPNGQLPYTGILQTLTKISSQEGVLSLFNGFLPYYLRCGGHTVSMFVFIQLMRDAYATSTL
jgi:solute carrier family 25 oxoglutarate transporter 11